MSKPLRISPDLQRWIDARKRFHLTHAEVQMARELGMDPRKLGGLANHRQERWKLPLPQFLQQAYRERFGRDLPERVESIEERLRAQAAKRAARRARRRLHATDAERPGGEA
jgi:hypothetical protein